MSTDGLITDGLEVVEFPICDLDSLDRGRQRLLWQFKNSCVIDQILQAISAECQELIDACCAILIGRLPQNAAPSQLDDIGSIVGQIRTPVPNPAGGFTDPTEAQYLGQIIAKIFKNNIKYASYPEVVRFVKLMTGFDVSFKRTGPGELEIIVPAGLTEDERNFIIQISEVTQIAESIYLMPIEATGRLASIREYATNLFTPDKEANVPDIGIASVSGNLI